MRPMTLRGALKCRHETGGTVQQTAKHRFVRINGSPVLVKNDTLGRPVKGCVVTPPLKPCLVTIAETAGRSQLLFINGDPVLLTSVDGLTSGDPPGTVHYRAASAGHSLVSAP